MNHVHVPQSVIAADMNTKENMFEQLEAYYDPVKAFIFSMVKDSWTAEDLTQETFVRSQKYSHEVRDRTKIKSWLFKVAYNICQDHFRKNSGKSAGSFQFDDLRDTANSADTEKIFDQYQMSQCMQKQILLLPEQFRAILWLFDVDGFKQSEIAQILATTEGNVKVRLHRARKKFKSILVSNCTFEKDNRNILVCLPR
jgi:RNA polymerase sigma-70 factor, ECF subfamily